MQRNIVFQMHLVFRNNVPTMNNNNNNSPLMQMRDRLFQIVFIRLTVNYATLFPRFVRSIVENVLLLFAMLCLCMLFYLHITFIHSPMNCLDETEQKWSHDGILRIEILHNSQSNNYTLEESYNKEAQIRAILGYSVSSYVQDISLKNMPNFDEVGEGAGQEATTPALEYTDIFNSKIFYVKNIETFQSQMFNKSTAESSKSLYTERPSNWSKGSTESSYMKFWYKILELMKQEDFITELSQDVHIVEYSLEYGYLRLSPKARRRLNIPVMLVTLDPSVNKCFGNWFTQTLLGNFLGYDDVLMASIRKLAGKEENKGYMHNVVTDHYFRFVNLMNHASYVFAAAVMLIFTLSISMLLRYSHQQIFVFIVQLLRLFELRVTSGIAAAPLLTVILSLIGMEAIMSEFFSDPTTSFYVILIVWIADQYDSICCRTLVTKRHWLRFFYLYHFAFYAYDYRFSGQYSDWALLTSCAFIFHSMVYFYHHFELPAILRAVDEHHQQHRRSSSSDPQPPSPVFERSSDSSTRDQDQSPPDSSSSPGDTQPNPPSTDESSPPDNSQTEGGHTNSNGLHNSSAGNQLTRAPTSGPMSDLASWSTMVKVEHPKAPQQARRFDVCQNQKSIQSSYSTTFQWTTSTPTTGEELMLRDTNVDDYMDNDDLFPKLDECQSLPRDLTKGKSKYTLDNDVSSIDCINHTLDRDFQITSCANTQCDGNGSLCCTSSSLQQIGFYVVPVFLERTCV